MLNLLKKKRKGFTLMEMLIVVAIIAILVAIAIPTFNNALTRTQEAADEANVRAFYAQQVAEYMLDPVTNVAALTATYPTGGDADFPALNFAAKLTTNAINQGMVYEADEIDDLSLPAVTG